MRKSAAIPLLIFALFGMAWAINARLFQTAPFQTAPFQTAPFQTASPAALKNSEKHATGSLVPDLPTAEEFRQSWPSFRGPDGSGVSTHADVPAQWNGTSGEGILWKTATPLPGTNSPIVVEIESRPRIITCGDPWVIAYSPRTGAEIWRADCLAPAEIGPSPVYCDGMVFAANDYAALSAIRADGTGDVSHSHIQWSVEMGLPDICSPLATEQFILLLSSDGVLTCYNQNKGGDPLWEEDFETEFVSSPGLAGDRVYLFSRTGKTWIVRPTREKCKRTAEADLGEPCVTSPAFQNGRIYIRGNKHLFCIGSKR